MALPKILWNYPALCWLLAVPILGSLGLECGEHQHRFHGKCCSDCAPGQRMRSRCTASADTVCSPCQDGYFSSQHHHGFCRSCTICNARRGSVEVKPCEKTSDRECECRAGFEPRGRECSPCPKGTFSRGRNENCQPWTNCSVFGRSTVRAGTATEDALCSTPGLDPRTSGPPGKGDPLPSGSPGKGDPLPSGSPGKGDPRPSGSPGKGDPLPSGSPGKGDPLPSGPLGKGDPLPSGPPGKGDPLPSGLPGMGDPRPSGPPGKGDPLPSGPPGKGDPRPSGPPGKGDPLPSGSPGKGDPLPSGSPGKGDPLPTEFPRSSPREVPADPGSPAWGSLSLLLLCLMLLLVSGISILLLILQAAQKKTRNGSGRSIQHTQRSCRLPVQEEQLDPSSSLIQNCPGPTQLCRSTATN